ncbi:MAG: DUF6089 family protein [Bacteroidota bacterium]|nr:DUF6089 family protein [Bacteroidota bacterium]MDX5468917.1 DUF6089 family protein [Bacteroidota bacterium]
MKKVYFLFLLSLIGLSASAQKSVDVGIMLGGSNYQGELSSTPYDNIHFAGGLVGRYNINDHFSLKGNAFYGTISGADSTSTNQFSLARNLSFRSELFEFAALIEWNLWAFDPIARNGKKGFTPFAFIGAAVYKYNPKAYFIDPNSDFRGWVELQPLGTEGQGTTQFQDRKKYNLTQFSIPFGGGVKMRLAPGWTVALEYGLRKTFNDYIDDVSMTYVEPGILDQTYGSIEQGGYSSSLADRSSVEVRNARTYDPLTFQGEGRGNPKSKDWYAYGGITITYTIFGNRVKCFTF